MVRILLGLMLLFIGAKYSIAEDSPEQLLQRGVSEIRLKNFKGAIDPLKSCFETSTNSRTKIRASEALMVAYRETANVTGYLDSADYVIANSEHKATRSVNGTQVYAFLHFNGKMDEAIKRYEQQLKDNNENVAALTILANIYERSDRENKPLAKQINETLAIVNKRIATEHAKKLESEAVSAPATAAWLLKDAAQFWLEADEKDQAIKSAKESLKASPESRNTILTYQYRDALGEIFAANGEPGLAAEQYELAIKSAPEGILKTNVEKKLKQLKEQSK